EEEDICSLSIYISWDIWGEKTAYTPRMKCPDLAFNSSSVYRIADLFYFFKNVLSEYLIFRVNIVRQNDTSRTLARAKVSIKDILDYPQNKLHYIVPVNSVIACFFGVNFGQLSLWVRLSCNVDMVEAFKRQCGITSLRDITHALAEKKDTYDIPQKSPPRDSPTFITTIVSEDRDSKDTPVPSLDSTFYYRDSGHIQGTSLLKEASSTIRDMNEVFSEKNWKEYKERSLLTFTKFQIDEQTHPMERETLRTMLAKSVNPNIKFIIISEPLPEETEIKECEDIGYATFNIKKYALSNGRKDILLPIKDNRNEQIGVLKVICTNKIYLFVNHDLVSAIKFKSIVDHGVGFGHHPKMFTEC
ncbi:hypothetical protein X777_15768, partial [Ooceraea biroi]